MGGDIKYTCSNGSWNKTGEGKCTNGCIGSPNFIDNSKLYTTSGKNVGYTGTFHNINTNEVTAPTTDNINSLYAENGAILDADCKSGYTEIYLVDSAYNANNGNRKDWGHYYYCDNGNWKTVSRCIKSENHIYNTAGSYSVTTPTLNTNEQLTLNLEAYGAQGGGDNGGKGGYSKGNYTIKGKITLNIVVGGQGGKPNGGYNGGGNGGSGCGSSGNDTAPGGGGKTNIDLNDTSLIIAGGGGGASEDGKEGGRGGGTNGSNGNGYWKGFGGTQSSGGDSSGTCSNSGKGNRDKGGNGCGDKGEGTWCGGGGGGGYYGGGGGDWGTIKDDNTAGGGSGGGGSGYCDSNRLASGSCSMSNSQRSGDGYAKISW